MYIYGAEVRVPGYTSGRCLTALLLLDYFRCVLMKGRKCHKCGREYNYAHERQIRKDEEEDAENEAQDDEDAEADKENDELIKL